MKLDEMFPSKYLKASDIEGDTVFVVAGVSMETMKDKQGNETEKPVLIFTDSKPMVLNRTNADAIKSIYGDDTDEWTGKPITLFVAEVSAFGETTPAIRVRDAKAMQRKSKPVASGNGTDLNLHSAKVKWNTAAKAAKDNGFAALLDQYRPKPDADVAAIMAAIEGLNKHVNSELTEDTAEFA